MSYYKIKNITNKLAKRDISKDVSVKIEYHVGFQKKFHSLIPNNIVVLSCRNLPMSIHILKSKNLITVQEITENEFVRLQKPSAKKKPIVTEISKKEPVLAETEAPKKQSTKKTTKKSKVESTVTVKED